MYPIASFYIFKKIFDIVCIFYIREWIFNFSISSLDAKEMRRRRRTFYRDCANSILEGMHAQKLLLYKILEHMM